MLGPAGGLLMTAVIFAYCFGRWAGRREHRILRGAPLLAAQGAAVEHKHALHCNSTECVPFCCD